MCYRTLTMPSGPPLALVLARRSASLRATSAFTSAMGRPRDLRYFAMVLKDLGLDAKLASGAFQADPTNERLQAVLNAYDAWVRDDLRADTAVAAYCDRGRDRHDQQCCSSWWRLRPARTDNFPNLAVCLREHVELAMTIGAEAQIGSRVACQLFHGHRLPLAGEEREFINRGQLTTCVHLLVSA